MGKGGGVISRDQQILSGLIEYMSYSLDSLKGGYVGDSIGDDNGDY